MSRPADGEGAGNPWGILWQPKQRKIREALKPPPFAGGQRHANRSVALARPQGFQRRPQGRLLAGREQLAPPLTNEVGIALAGNLLDRPKHESDHARVVYLEDKVRAREGQPKQSHFFAFVSHKR
ncbi:MULTISPECIES: hypothetical protein [Caulobacter]|uniref:hypothetical protein n=1 Tax=Caulobacter TaxID=75 RepID=UPI0013F40E93|nr:MULTISPECIES: hypothetical protein [Caulobacter]MBQ1560616.1 hypothetical protein [Caulobacter sp.]